MQSSAGGVIWNYTYDAANQMISAASGDTTRSFTYDAAGQRLTKAANGQTRRHLYQDKNLLAVLDGEGAVQEYNILEDDGSIICGQRGTTADKYWYRQDIRGSITNIIDNAETVKKSYTYDAFGNTAQSGSFQNSFAYTGAVLDEETGLYYMNARYYDPSTGRFVSQDSYRGESEGLWHLYAYCDSDPVNFTDPTGHYSRQNAIKYAKRWYNGRNPEFKSYATADCANFVSQCLYAGGIKMNNAWYSRKNTNKIFVGKGIGYTSGFPTFQVGEPWRLVRKMTVYFSKPQYIYSTLTLYNKKQVSQFINRITYGDIAFTAKPGQSFGHAIIINRVDYRKKTFYYAGHTNSRWDHDIGKVIVYRMKNSAR